MKSRLLLVLLLTVAFITTENAKAQVGTATLQASATVGEPFGVIVADLPLPPDIGGREPRVVVEDSQGRLFYPVVSIRRAPVSRQPRRGLGRPGGLIDRVRNAIESGVEPELAPVGIRVAALVRGPDPIDLQISGDLRQTVHLEPRSTTASEHTNRLSLWWGLYTSKAAEDLKREDFPGLVHKYLVSMLSNRLGLKNVDLDPEDPNDDTKSKPLETLALLAAIEPLREQILEDVLSYAADSTVPDQPVPNAPAWIETITPELGHETEIEDIATRVPPECFYARFGAFSNFVWFQDLSQRFGGDIAQAVMLRGFNANTQARMEQMLAAKMTTLAKMFGDSVVSDMAVIGTDLYIKEGASLGVIFKARNISLLSFGLDEDRKAAAAKNPDARVHELTIAGRKVRLLSTPDNRIRSFHVADGEYVFITTSRKLMERFLEVGESGDSLATRPAFRWTRQWLPEANDYTIFAYLSPEFFHGLMSPQYQIELQRRLEAIAHLEIAEMASQAAMAEGFPHQDIQQLKQAGFLPRWFDERPDGAQTLRIDGKWIDSLRGGRGSFMPISDAEFDGVTLHESLRYTRTASYYLEEWGHMDPLVFGVRRFQGEAPEVERITFEGYLAPFEADKYGWIARQLGAPTPVEIHLPADDAVSMQANVRGSPLLGTDDYHLFAGIKDMTPPDPEKKIGILKILQFLRSAPAYIGGWPKPGIVDQLPLGIGRALSNPDYAGFSRMIGGLWRWQDGAFSLLSFDRSILENTAPQLAVSDATDMAQARVRVNSLQGGQLADWINSYWYNRAWRASQANSRLLDTVHQQLKVTSADCLQVTERLLDVELQCPLGGTYEFSAPPTVREGWWESTAWSKAGLASDGSTIAPADYTAPWIEWFRGGRVHVTQQPTSLAVIGEVMMATLPPSVKSGQQSPIVLPQMNFDLFSLPSQLFGGQKEETKRKSF